MGFRTSHIANTQYLEQIYQNFYYKIEIQTDMNHIQNKW